MTKEELSRALALREIKTEVDDKNFVAPKKIPTFRKAGDEWLKSKLKGHDVSTVSNWHTHLTAHLYPTIGDRRLDWIDVRVVECEVRDVLAKTLSVKTVNKVLTTGASVFKMAMRHRLAKTNPFRDAERLKLEVGEDSPISEDDVYTPRRRERSQPWRSRGSPAPS